MLPRSYAGAKAVAEFESAFDANEAASRLSSAGYCARLWLLFGAIAKSEEMSTALHTLLGGASGPTAVPLRLAATSLPPALTGVLPLAFQVASVSWRDVPAS